MTRRMFVTRADREALDLIVEKIAEGPHEDRAAISNRALAKRLGLSYNRQATRHWSRLQEMGLIEVMPRFSPDTGFQPNMIILRPGAAEASVGDVCEFEGTPT